MARQTHKLTDLKIRALKVKGLHGDGNGLYLRITPTGTKGWVFRYKRGRRADGAKKVYDLGIGTYPELSLTGARTKAAEFRGQLAVGVNPAEARKVVAPVAVVAPAEKSVVTFDAAVAQFLEGREGGWKNDKHRSQWRSTLKTYASPVIGMKDVGDITTADVLTVLNPIWQTKGETAARVRGRIENVMNWCRVNKFRDGENPAAWRGHLEYILSARNKKRTVRHHPAMPFAKVPAFMDVLRESTALSSLALQFTILTAVRTSEAIQATWEEIDQVAKLWVVPKVRMKADVEFRVPLTDAALAVLESLPRREGNPYLFPGAKTGHSLSSMAMLELLRGHHAGLTVHGFRSSFRDWAGDNTDFPRDTIEMCLAHAVKDEVEAAYRRSDMIAKRRKVMDAWAQFCGH